MRSSLAADREPRNTEFFKEGEYVPSPTKLLGRKLLLGRSHRLLLACRALCEDFGRTATSRYRVEGIKWFVFSRRHLSNKAFFIVGFHSEDRRLFPVWTTCRRHEVSKKC